MVVVPLWCPRTLEVKKLEYFQYLAWENSWTWNVFKITKQNRTHSLTDSKYFHEFMEEPRADLEANHSGAMHFSIVVWLTVS